MAARLLRRGPWRELTRQYWCLLSVQLVESVSEWAFSTMVLFWVFTQSDVPLDQATGLLLILLCATAPKVVAAPATAWLVDRYRWSQTLGAAIALRSALLVGLAAVFFAAHSSVVQLVALGCVLVCQSVTGLVIESSRSAAMQVAIPDQYREFAASLSMFSLTGISVVAATTAVSTFVWGSFAFGLMVCTAFSVSGLIVLAVMPKKDLVVPPQHGLGFAANLRTGMALVARRPQVVMVTLGMSAYGLCLGAIGFAMPMLLLETLAGSEVLYAVITEIFAFAVLVGSIVTPLITHKFATYRVYLVAAIALACTYVGLGSSGSLWVAGIVMACCGVSFSVFSVTQGPLLHRAVPPGQMGTVAALLSPLRSVMQLVGAVVVYRYARWNESIVGLEPGRFGYFVSAVTLVLAVLCIWASKRRHR